MRAVPYPDLDRPLDLRLDRRAAAPPTRPTGRRSSATRAIPRASRRSTSATAISCWRGPASTRGISLVRPRRALLGLAGRSALPAADARPRVACLTPPGLRPRHDGHACGRGPRSPRRAAPCLARRAAPVETPFLRRVGGRQAAARGGAAARSRRASSTSRPWAARPGQPGGTWRMLMGDQRDLRMMTVYSYARLVVFDEKLQPRPRHPGKPRQPGRQGLHPASAHGPQMVGRAALHGRRLPLLLGGCRQQPEAVAVGPEPGAAGRRQAAEFRGPRSADGALHLGGPEPRLPAGAGGRPAALHLHAGALPEAVPPEIRRQGQARRKPSRPPR